MHIRPMQPEDAEQAFQLRVTAFTGAMRIPYDAAEIYIPNEHRLVAVDRGRVVGHLGVWSFHQAFMGRAVPMGGVSAVAVADEMRGRGFGSRLIAAGLDHMGATGMAISTLYPSTPVPYRRWGWEHAGVHVRRRVATRDLLDVPGPTTDVELRPYAPTDLDALVAVHDGLTIREPGGLVAGERWLRRALEPDHDDPEIVTVAARDGRPVGLALAHKTSPEDDHSTYGLHVLRLFGVDRDVERALWRSIGHHHPVAATTVFRSRPAEPLLFDLPFGMHQPAPPSDHFMTRIVDAPAAIAARGWPAVSATVDLHILDARRAANNGRFRLQVGDRTAALVPGGNGRVTIDIGTLSSLYTGFVTATEVAHAGRLAGATAGDVRALTDVFCAPMPFLRDYF